VVRRAGIERSIVSGDCSTRNNLRAVTEPTREVAFALRPAGLDDVDFLVEVVFEATRAQGRSLPGGLDDVEWRKDYAEGTRKLLRGEIADSALSVIELDGAPVGRLRVTRDGSCIELSGIQLLPDVQGRGIGTAIITALKSEAVAAGVPLEISVENDNPRARQLYQRLGLVAIGEGAEEARLRWEKRVES
jgi:GNAT superfamily N-acetyltransferase